MQPVVRALNVLRLLASHAGGLTLQELGDALDIPPGSMHRLLAVLSAEQFVSRSPTNRRYFLGPAARQLADSGSAQHRLLVSPHRALTELARQSQETVFLTELVGDRALCVALVEGRHPLRLFVRIGQDMPLHAAASARTLLADRTDEEARLMLAGNPLTSYTESTPSSVEQVLEHLAVIRTRGYDVCEDELDRGVWAVSAPIHMSTGRVCTSITLAAPGDRLATPRMRKEARDAVLAAAATMAADLGYGEAHDQRRDSAGAAVAYRGSR